MLGLGKFVLEINLLVLLCLVIIYGGLDINNRNLTILEDGLLLLFKEGIIFERADYNSIQLQHEDNFQKKGKKGKKKFDI